MTTFVIRRFLLAIPTIIGVSFLVFISIRAVPGGPAQALAGELATPEFVAALEKKMGLDRPLLEQYLIYIGSVLRGDLGTSIITRVPVVEEIGIRLPRTLLLTSVSLFFATLIGITIGVLASTRPNSWFDTGSMIVALLGVSMPVFWLGLMLMIFFANLLPQWLGQKSPILPPSGFGTWQNMVMPVMVLATNAVAIQARMTRACMLEVLRQDYVRTARAKGMRERVVIYRHALRNALLPIVTIIGLQFGTLLGGAVITETVFSWPGVGRGLIEAIRNRDYAVVQGFVLVITIGFVFINLLVDIIYAYLDPRIQYQ